MQGQSECLSECVAVKDAFEYKFLTDSLSPLKNPVGEDITYEYGTGYPYNVNVSAPGWRQKHALGSACYGHTNLVPSFCRAYVAGTGRQAVAVHAAKGSTEIKDWLPGTLLYEALKKKSLTAINKCKPEHIYFAWLQGESDAIAAVKKDDYKKMLRELCDALKSDLGIERFGIIRVGYFTKDARDEQIILAQSEICEEDEDFLMLTDIATTLNGMPEYMHPTIGGHFSAKGLEALGKVAGEALALLK